MISQTTENLTQEARIWVSLPCSRVSEMKRSVVTWETPLPSAPVLRSPLQKPFWDVSGTRGHISINRLHQRWGIQHSVLYSTSLAVADAAHGCSQNGSCRTCYTAGGAFPMSTKQTGLLFCKGTCHLPCHHLFSTAVFKMTKSNLHFNWCWKPVFTVPFNTSGN